MVYALWVAGADAGALIAFIASWSLLGFNRLIVWELPLLGVEFTAIRYVACLPLPILVWDNGKLGEIEDSMVRSQIAPNAVVARNPDFLALARAYGAGAVQPETLEALQEAIRQALVADRPTLIRVTPDIAP